MKKSELGQALLVILLVMAVGLTIALAVISRSVTDIKISRQEEESARAFSAAEAGLEQALISGEGDYTIGDITAQVTETAQGGGTLFDFGGGEFEEGEAQTVWLIEHTADGDLGGASFPENGTIIICWGESISNMIAVEATLIYQDGSDFKVARGAYDSDASRIVDNSFDLADEADGNNCGSLAFAETVDLAADLGLPSGSTPYALRLKLLYNSEAEPLAVASTANLPSQGTCLESVAEIEGSGVTRRIQQCQFHKVPPAIFDYVLFSEANLSQ